MKLYDGSCAKCYYSCVWGGGRGSSSPKDFFSGDVTSVQSTYGFEMQGGVMYQCKVTIKQTPAGEALINLKWQFTA